MIPMDALEAAEEAVIDAMIKQPAGHSKQPPHTCWLKLGKKAGKPRKTRLRCTAQPPTRIGARHECVEG